MGGPEPNNWWIFLHFPNYFEEFNTKMLLEVKNFGKYKLTSPIIKHGRVLRNLLTYLTDKSLKQQSFQGFGHQIMNISNFVVQ